MPVLVKIHRQQNRLRAQLGGFHQTHGRADAEFAGGVGGSGDHAATCIAGDTREKFKRNFCKMLSSPFLFRVGGRQFAQQIVRLATAPANHHWQAFELRIAQQLDGGIKRIHVKVGYAAGQGGHDGGWQGQDNGL